MYTDATAKSLCTIEYGLAVVQFSRSSTLHADLSGTVVTGVDKVSGFQLHFGITVEWRCTLKNRKLLISLYVGIWLSIVHPMIVLRFMYILCSLGSNDMLSELRVLQ